MDSELGKMTILSHINELRKRLLVVVVALAITTFASFAFSQMLAELLAKPIGGLSAMASIEVTENVTAFMKISLLSGVVLAMPIIVFEILAFVMPGLNPNERKWIWFVIPVATLFFAGGVAFAYLVMLPAALPFLLEFMGITTVPRPDDYFSFVLNLLFWVGVCFEMPLLMLVLSRLGIIKPKALIKQWRIALIGSAILAALITPTPDPVNMGLMMIPLIGLYFIGIIFAVIGQKKTNDGSEKKNIQKPPKEKE
jgi:sec-independent protein translocase protein TatC